MAHGTLFPFTQSLSKKKTPRVRFLRRPKTARFSRLKCWRLSMACLRPIPTLKFLPSKKCRLVSAHLNFLRTSARSTSWNSPHQHKLINWGQSSLHPFRSSRSLPMMRLITAVLWPQFHPFSNKFSTICLPSPPTSTRMRPPAFTWWPNPLLGLPQTAL